MTKSLPEGHGPGPGAVTLVVAPRRTGRVRELLQGVGISGLNPKGLILLVSLLPTFIGPDATWPVATQITALGLVHTATCGVVYGAVGYSARALLGSRPGLARAVSRFSASAMVTIGLFLLIHPVV